MAILNPNPYKFDPTGSQTNNRVVGEQHIVTHRNHKDIHFLVPKFAPFFEKNLVVKYQETGTTIPDVLVFNKDYYLTHLFRSGSLSVASPLYGSITLLRRDMQGVITLEYNTLGGDWLIDEATIQKILADRLHNPRITYWDQVAELPYRFPVTNHDWNIKDMYGAKEITTSILDVAGAIREKINDENLQNTRIKALFNKLTKDKVGLDLVENLPILPENLWNNTSDDYYVTPRTVHKMILETALSALNTHLKDKKNPHELTSESVGTYNKETIDGKITELNKRLQQVIDTGIDDTTFDKLKEYLLANPISNAATLEGKTVATIKNEITSGDLLATKLSSQSGPLTGDDILNKINEASKSGGTGLSLDDQERLEEMIDKFADIDPATIDAYTLEGKSYNELMSEVGNVVEKVRTTQVFPRGDHDNISGTPINGILIPIASQDFIKNPLVSDNSPNDYAVFNIKGFSTSFSNSSLGGASISTVGKFTYTDFSNDTKYRRELSKLFLDINIGIRKVKSISDTISLIIYNEFAQVEDVLFNSSELLGILNSDRGGIYYRIVDIENTDPVVSRITYYLYQKPYYGSGNITNTQVINGISLLPSNTVIQLKDNEIANFTRIPSNDFTVIRDFNNYNGLAKLVKSVKENKDDITEKYSALTRSIAVASSNASKAIAMVNDISDGLLVGEIDNGRCDLSSGTFFTSNNLIGFSNINTNCSFTLVTNINSIKTILTNTPDMKIYLRDNNITTYTVYDSSNADQFPEFITNTEMFIFRMVCYDRQILCVV